MNKAILLKKLNDNKIVYTMTDKTLNVECGEFGVISITLDSDYYLYYLFFKLIEKMEQYANLEL